jgi:hypothetical protein
MKASFRYALAAAPLLLLGACATTDEMAGAPRAMDVVATDTEFVTDEEYILTVNYLAKRRGTRVVWVNPPKVRVDRETRERVAGR